MVAKNVIFKLGILTKFYFNCINSSSIIKQPALFCYNYSYNKKMSTLDSFMKYQKFEAVNKQELDLVSDYICGNLNSLGCYYPYWYDMFSYVNKSRMVIRHRERKNQTGIAKLGECVCKDQVINFLQNKNKCNCNKGCASVYFKVIF